MKRTIVTVLIMAFIMTALVGCGSAVAVDEAETQAQAAAATQAATETAGLANPWIDTDYEGMKQATGLDLNIPSYAKDVVYRAEPEEGIAEVQFTIEETGTKCTARVKPTATAEDISGAYYTWENEEECKIDYCSGKTGMAKTENGMIEYCTWFDAVPGISYSLIAEDKDLDGFDITAVAIDLFRPMQGDAQGDDPEAKAEGMDLKDYAGSFGIPGEATTLTIEKDGSVKVDIYRLTSMEGKVTAAEGTAVNMVCTDANGGEMKLTYDNATCDLVVTDSTWSLLPNGETFHLIPMN